MAARANRRPSAATLVRRWLAVLAIGLVGYLYYHPLRSWFETRSELGQRRAEVAQLAETNRELRRRLTTASSLDALGREARRLGFIRPGEHLFIVKGIQAWKKAHSRLGSDGR
jgi:cell division protein FtsB